MPGTDKINIPVVDYLPEKLIVLETDLGEPGQNDGGAGAPEEATRRSTFLAEASTVLTNSLDFEATVRGLLQLTVPFLGDLAAVTLAGEAGPPRRSELAYLLPPTDKVHLSSLPAAEKPQ